VYAVVNEDDGVGSGLVSRYESDIDWASAAGGSVTGAGDDEET
jgi:hypothetical protein